MKGEKKSERGKEMEKRFLNSCWYWIQMDTTQFFIFKIEKLSNFYSCLKLQFLIDSYIWWFSNQHKISTFINLRSFLRFSRIYVEIVFEVNQKWPIFIHKTFKAPPRRDLYQPSTWEIRNNETKITQFFNS